MDTWKVLTLAVLLVALLVAWTAILSTYWKVKPIEDYISDEQWYVVSSINIFRRVFGVQPDTHVNRTHSLYTFVVEGDPYECAREASGIARLRVIAYTTSKISSFTAIVADKDLPVLRMLSCVVDVFPGRLPDETSVNNYMNWEHPLLVKLEIGLSMLLLGYHSWAWRLPSLVAGLAIALLILAAIVLVEGPTIYGILGLLVAATVLAIDPSVKTMSSIAMLDIHVALFTLASLIAVLRQRFLLAGIMLGLAGSAKYSGYFGSLALLAVTLSRGLGWRKAILYSVIVPLAVGVIVWSPGILYLGPRWFSEVVGSIQWHLTSRPPGGPPSTSAVGLMLCLSTFPLYYVDGFEHLYATCLPQLMVLGLASTVFTALAVLVDGRSVRLYPPLYLVSVIAGYWLVYLAGNHTLYQFYSTHFTPLAAVTVAQLPYSLIVLSRAELGDISRRLREYYAVWVERYRWLLEAAARAAVLLASMYMAYHNPLTQPPMGLPAQLAQTINARIMAAVGSILYLLLTPHIDTDTALLLAFTIAATGLSYQAAIDTPTTILLYILNAPLASWALIGVALSTPLPLLLSPTRPRLLAGLAVWIAASTAARGHIDLHELLAAAILVALTLTRHGWRLRMSLIPIIDGVLNLNTPPLWVVAGKRKPVKTIVAGLAAAYSIGAGLAAAVAASTILVAEEFYENSLKSSQASRA